VPAVEPNAPTRQPALRPALPAGHGLIAPPRLDLRGLVPPEPMQRTLEAAAQLESGATLVTLTRFRPVHLLTMLEEQGLMATSTAQPDGSWENVITRSAGAGSGGER